MEVQCLKVKIKTGCTDYVIDWMKGMQKKMNLVYEALAAETMVVEGGFVWNYQMYCLHLL